jgi:cobalt transporter subunit CbtB
MQTSAVLSSTSTRVLVMSVPWPALGVLVLGLIMIYSVGFSTFRPAHNAAHDTRHANGFPCH